MTKILQDKDPQPPGSHLRTPADPGGSPVAGVEGRWGGPEQECQGVVKHEILKGEC